ncbi:MAG: hypothetical protein KDC83_13515 [Flavobacteriales bacterium]|nr:hypothetical protein [Flavobacteriales bacterium]
MKKKILFTFDYELFLGAKSGSVLKCLIEPTEKVINVLNTYSFLGIFFVDTTYLTRLKSQNEKRAQEDFLLVKNQILSLVSQGHYVFPHIHPHWLDATYQKETNSWTLESTSKYRFEALSTEERELIFRSSIETLKEITNQCNPDYKIDSFRAGGWCIQPFADFRPFFSRFNIQNEFSVLTGQSYNSKAQQFDFRKIEFPEIYRFSNNVTLKDAKGEFTEFPISTMRISTTHIFLNRLWLKYLWKTGDRSIGDGQGVRAEEGATIGRSDLEMISIELLNRFKLFAYLSYTDNHEYIQFISHPKMLSPHNISIFKKYLKAVNKRYKVETDFKKLMN